MLMISLLNLKSRKRVADDIIVEFVIRDPIREWLQQRSEAKPAESSEARICRLLGLGRYDRFSIIFLIIKMTIPAEELVRSIKLAMEDKAMAANLERIHQIYMDREQKPVEKVTIIFCITSMHYAEVVMENGIWFSRPF